MRYSVAGFLSAWRDEAAFRQELCACAVLLPLALWLPLPPTTRLMLIGSLVLVLVVELLNSAIEATVDRVGTEHHPLAKKAKDLGSAAVMLSVTFASVTWAVLLWPLLRAYVGG